MLDTDFKIERPMRYYRQGINLLHGEAPQSNRVVEQGKHKMSHHHKSEDDAHQHTQRHSEDPNGAQDGLLHPEGHEHEHEHSETRSMLGTIKKSFNCL